MLGSGTKTQEQMNHEDCKRVCNDFGITQLALATETGFSERTIRNYLSGKQVSQQSQDAIQQALRELLALNRVVTLCEEHGLDFSSITKRIPDSHGVSSAGAIYRDAGLKDDVSHTVNWIRASAEEADATMLDLIESLATCYASLLIRVPVNLNIAPNEIIPIRSRQGWLIHACLSKGLGVELQFKPLMHGEGGYKLKLAKPHNITPLPSSLGSDKLRQQALNYILRLGCQHGFIDSADRERALKDTDAMDQCLGIIRRAVSQRHMEPDFLSAYEADSTFDRELADCINAELKNLRVVVASHETSVSVTPINQSEHDVLALIADAFSAIYTRRDNLRSTATASTGDTGMNQINLNAPIRNLSVQQGDGNVQFNNQMELEASPDNMRELLRAIASRLRDFDGSAAHDLADEAETLSRFDESDSGFMERAGYWFAEKKQAMAEVAHPFVKFCNDGVKLYESWLKHVGQG